MSITGMFKGTGPTGFGYDSTSLEVTEGLDLNEHVFLVTGANSGIGADTLRTLSARGATVIAAARTVEKARKACAQAPNAIPLACELSEPSSVRAAVEAVRRLDRPLDGIIANAGIMWVPRREVKYGVELHLLTNHVGHFVLVTGLLDRLAERGRVVMVSSTAHLRPYAEGVRLDDFASERGYSPLRSYGQSKLANLLFARHLATRLADGQTANAVHPGVIATELTRNLPASVQAAYRAFGPSLFAKSLSQGAATQCYVATHPDAATITGQYWKDCNVALASHAGRDDALAEALWQKTEEVVAGLP